MPVALNKVDLQFSGFCQDLTYNFHVGSTLPQAMT